ncbi:MAG: family 10 glycosylhydrolase [Planctomycetes bacterium]|nr:family 10 glycosylhydrolase [Planctomycetota bacterium]
MTTRFGRWLLLAPLVLGCAAPRAHEAPARLLWVTRWDFRGEADVRRVVADADAAGFEGLLFQVRGNATCFFPSELEPWAEQFDFRSPGYDPLAVALEEAHARGLELHAWMNVTPAWWGPGPPACAEHVVNTHPEWLWYDAAGRPQPYSERFYVSLNPCLPEVRAHVVGVVREVLARYDVDGLHLDYVRFPNELVDGPDGADYPRDARTLDLFHAASGATPDAAPRAWDAWRADQVTELVRDVRAAQRELAPRAVLSAAVGPDPEAAARHFQDWRRWIDEGLVDALMPMNYAAAPERYGPRCVAWDDYARDVDVRMGISARAGEPALVTRRLRDAEQRYGGWALFGYLSLWDSANDVIDRQTPERSAERAALRAELLPVGE